jgi:hypothetical protein
MAAVGSDLAIKQLISKKGDSQKGATFEQTPSAGKYQDRQSRRSKLQSGAEHFCTLG